MDVYSVPSYNNGMVTAEPRDDGHLLLIAVFHEKILYLRSFDFKVVIICCIVNVCEAAAAAEEPGGFQDLVLPISVH